MTKIPPPPGNLWNDQTNLETFKTTKIPSNHQQDLIIPKTTKMINITPNHWNDKNTSQNIENDHNMPQNFKNQPQIFKSHTKTTF